MLMALLALFLFGSSGTATFFTAFDQAKPFIKKDIDDKTRRKDLLTIIENTEKMPKGFVKASKKTVKELSGITERHDAKAEDFEPVLERLRADTVALQENMVRQTFALKTKMSREEWSKAFPREESSPAPTAVQTK